MLKQRAATAAVLASLILISAYWLPTPWFALVLALCLLVAAIEWCTLAELSDRHSQLLWLIAIASTLLVLWGYQQYLIPITVAVGVVWWVGVVLILCLSSNQPQRKLFKTVAGVMVLLPAWAALVYLHQASVSLVLALFAIVWLADIGAYFTGKRWGVHKLAPVISPGKTVEGVVGGIVLVILFSFTVSIWQDFSMMCAVLWLGVCVTTSLFSIVGDLWESSMKRAVNIKDSGSILPGHGGVLDRIDSVTAASPVFAVLVYGMTQQVGHCIEFH